MRATIKLKLASAFAVLLLILVGVIAIGVMRLGDLNTTFNTVIEGPTAQLGRARAIDGGISMVIRMEKNLVMQDNETKRRDLKAGHAANKKKVEETLNLALDKASEKARPMWTQLAEQWEDLAATSDRVVALSDSDRTAAAALTMGLGREQASKMSKTAEKLIDFNEKQLAAAVASSDQFYADARNLMLTLGVIAVLITLGAATWLSLNISRGLARADVAMRQVAEGDLTKFAEITTNDEIADLLTSVNLMIERLRGVVGARFAVARLARLGAGILTGLPATATVAAPAATVAPSHAASMLQSTVGRGRHDAPMQSGHES